MPHITLECTSNVDMDFQSFFEELSIAMVDTGYAPKLGIKCRVVSSDEYYIIDGSPDYKMANLLFRMREGRPPEILEKFSQSGIDILKKYLKADIEKKKVIISTEIKELIKGRDMTFNSVR